MIKSPAAVIAEARSQVKELTVQELSGMLAQDLTLIDVREPAEFSQGHIAGAVNIPRGVLEMKLHLHPKFAQHETPLDAMAQQPLYIVCASGGRSALAAVALQNMGFSQVFSVAGGMTAWSQAQFHVEQ